MAFKFNIGDAVTISINSASSLPYIGRYVGYKGIVVDRNLYGVTLYTVIFLDGTRDQFTCNELRLLW